MTAGRVFDDKMTPTLNAKGVLDLDSVKGCKYGMEATPGGGCHGLCYAAKIAKFRGFDFSVSVPRYIGTIGEMIRFRNIVHSYDLPMVRIGTMGDPSHDWRTTYGVAKTVAEAGKVPVIVTKHWRTMDEQQAHAFARIGAVLNTSISALDTEDQRRHRLAEYRLYPGQSVLRVVSCQFNRDIEEGRRLDDVQQSLFAEKRVLDNPLRVTAAWLGQKGGLVLAERLRDLNADVLISRANPQTYIGRCRACPDLCRLNL